MLEYNPVLSKLVKGIFHHTKHNFKTVFSSIIFGYSANDELEDIRVELVYFQKIIGYVALVILELLIIPVITTFFLSKVGNESILGKIILFIALSVVNAKITYSMMKEYAKGISIVIARSYIIIDYLNENEDIIINNINIKPRKRIENSDIFKIAVLVVCLPFIYIVIFLLQNWLDAISSKLIESEYFPIFSIMFVVVYLLYNLIKPIIDIRKSSKSVCNEAEIKFNDLNYCSFEERIREYCKNAGISKVTFKTYKLNSINAYANVEDSTISISTGLWNHLSLIREYEGEIVMDDILNMLICHEIAHLKYRDAKWIPVKSRLSATILLILIVTSMMTIIGLSKLQNTPMVTALIYIVLFLWLILFSIGPTISSPNYWAQMAELRADNYSLNIICKPETIGLFFKTLNQFTMDQKTTEVLNREKYIYRRFKRNQYPDYHPNAVSRNTYARANLKWKKSIYVRHLVQILLWKLDNKGVNGI
ncbi:M48 family metalloprotease [Erysipelothrix sp. HDW6C]|uniref:M48 family metallopeptidase n=1 Tax=Erysipelothrix sp. HDW6C TaxID=2714930 RepID=UPI00140A4D71|nr:M48 family metalloprotease [Erysipelothrix sp. HDW6C]QIK70579.1 M48 family metalloprotease [Erysipelothrix sp. HDW6C]